MPAYYIGLMSGTSVDGIDAVLVDFSSAKPELLAAQTYTWDARLHQCIVNALSNPEQTTLPIFGALDAQLGEAFAQAALKLINSSDVNAGQITAIGSHGQTLLHAPDAAIPFTTQAGDPNRIAELTGISTVADFRRRDIAAGGQGAPLVPAFHQALFQKAGSARAILNIGGIANLTLLPVNPEQPVSGFDTGPGNTLMDAWIKSTSHKDYDKNGDWARSGYCQPELLQDLLNHTYFTQAPPKSTGRELFNMAWLQQQAHARLTSLPPEDIQATLVELTARSISASLPPVDELYVCGGGAHNGFLMERLSDQLAGTQVATTEALGLAPDWVEATAFAWLAKQTLEGCAGNLHTATGARHAVILGGIYPSTPSIQP
ncbi:Anhydro-N-acetylmuramic acid kinase [hydrothermal vent metagenome]|uniref:Anhydro-N-acetylmuramic acid kinase n=1 Tax=hydrothermal vent metagenome TaxID=652676 RepID=A0A3B0ZNF4_9ZZZZ